jgi:hypothetical protein
MQSVTSFVTIRKECFLHQNSQAARPEGITPLSASKQTTCGSGKMAVGLKTGRGERYHNMDNMQQGIHTLTFHWV